MKKICIVTTRHISYNPRVLKEADALQAAGYAVSVVTISNHLGQSEFDRELMEQRSWRLRTVNYRRQVPQERRRWAWFSMRMKFFSTLYKLGMRAGVAERASEKAYPELVKLAMGERADLYIAHHAEALAVASRAARATGARMGFDAEDFHSRMGENEGGQVDKKIFYLEKKYLPRCVYMTAASKGIGRAYMDTYGVPEPVTILNVFPLPGQGSSSPESKARPDKPVQFYWYSQVIGERRGLEALIEAAGIVHARRRKEAEGFSFELHIRGSWQSEDFRAELERLAEQAGCRDVIVFHPPILAAEIIRDAAQFDVGLALESKVSFSRNICVTNKVFSYLMSGLALIITDTEGQKDIFTHFPEAGRLCGMDSVEELAEAMQYFIENPGRLREAKEAARRAAESSFHWELEAEKFLKTIRKALA